MKNFKTPLLEILKNFSDDDPIDGLLVWISEEPQDVINFVHRYHAYIQSQYALERYFDGDKEEYIICPQCNQ